MAKQKGSSSAKTARGRPSKPKDQSTRSTDAKTIKITNPAWDTLRQAKFELDSPSYSDAVIHMDTNPGKGAKQTSPEVKAKVPGEQLASSRKTIVISKKAYDILRRLKFEYYLESYSEAITHLNEVYRGLRGE
ncbi:MAG: hypothetical protein ACXACI_11090 [Candidatus Hodarchaeales archaeon]